MSASAVTTGLIQPLRQERVLLWCLLASIALHAVILLGISERSAPAPEVTPLSVLTARLMPAATAPRAQSSSPQPVLAPPSPPKPAPAPPQRAPAAETAKSAPPELAPKPAAPATAAP